MPKLSAAALAAAAAAQTATQEEPTRERPTDASGRILDEWGLPLAGPARLRALAGRGDPATDDSGWTEPVVEPLAIEDVPLPEVIIGDVPDAVSPDAAGDVASTPES